jgi:hypothetical protein
MNMRKLLTADCPDLHAIAAHHRLSLAYVAGWRIGWLGYFDDAALDCLTPTMGSRELDEYLQGKKDGGFRVDRGNLFR